MISKLKSLISKDQTSRRVAAEVARKRGHTSRDPYCRTCQVNPGEISTRWYVTFRLDSGEELELQVPGDACAELSEGDRGMLSFQGNRFLGFERK